MILRENTKAQSTVEFTFAMIVIMFLIYGMVQIFRWAGMDLAQRRYGEDASLMNADITNPAQQLNAGLDNVLPIAAEYHGKITNGNNSRP